MSLFDVVPEHPSAVCSMVEPPPVGESAAKIDSAVVAGIGRDAGGAIGKNMEKLVGISDASIRKHNRLYLLRQVHGRWKEKRAMGAQNNMEDEMGKTALGICDVCGERGALRTNHGKQMDTSCASIYAHLFNRLDLVAKVVVTEELTAKFMARVAALCGKDEMVAAMQAYLPDELAVQVSNKALDDIAKAIGYTGDRGDGLVDAVRGLAKERAVYQEERDRHGNFLVELRSITGQTVGPVGDLLATVREWKEKAGAVGELRMQVEATQLALGDICKAVGLPDDEGVTLKRIVSVVAEIAGHLEEVERIADCYGQGGTISEVIGDALEVGRLLTSGMAGADENIESLKVDVDSYRALYTSNIDELALVNGQLGEVTAKLRLNEAVVADIRDVLGEDAEGLLDTELAGAVANLCRPDGFKPLLVANGGMRDTVLLDLALDVLRGEVTGIDADRIGMMREIA